ncbi:hypothetical protein BS17DRAFT_691046, partial [Gyrodon lividus]
LSIITSSVSSEHNFSAAAFTITKCCNALKGDIVQAIQVLCMLYNHDLMFHEPPPFSALELDIKGEKNTMAAEPTATKDLSWILDLSDHSDVELYKSNIVSDIIYYKIIQFSTFVMLGLMQHPLQQL